MEPATTSQALPSGYRLGDYIIERVLRQGGFGVTYIANERDGAQRVVIKENLPAGIACRDSASRMVIPFTTTVDAGRDHDFGWALKNFLNEANILVTLDHPNIVKVLRAFSALNTAYYVMPYVGGASLEQWLEQNGRPDKATLIRLQRTLLSALDYVHAHGILHRDVKPSNILLQEDGEPVLIDFGSARHIISSRTLTLLHSPGYSPFEQTEADGNCGPWTDLYALGATLYTVVTGKRPPDSIARMSNPALLRPLCADPALVAAYGKPLLGCIDKALRMPTTERWQSAQEWLRALESGKRPKAPRRKKRKTWVIVGATVALTASGVWLVASPHGGGPGEAAPPADPEAAAAHAETVAGAVPATPASPLEEAAARGDMPAVEVLLAGGAGDDAALAEARVRSAVRLAGENAHWEVYARLLARLAESGDAQAQNDLGQCYQSGRGVQPDAAQAFHWHRKAAMQDNVAAQYNLAACYENGIGVEKNLEQAFYWYRRAAARGLGQEVAQQEEESVGVDATESVEACRQAAERGDADAQFRFAKRLHLGDGVPQHAQQAVVWYRRAAEQGHARAQNNLGLCYENGIGVEQDVQEAVKWYLAAAGQGNSIAQNNLGVCYENGTGVDRDPQEAVRWYLAAAEQGNSIAQNNLGICYDKGIGVEKDQTEAAKWYLAAAGQGDDTAQTNLGLCYENGTGVPQDWGQAAKWYLAAAEQGNPTAQSRLGVCYENGTGVPQDWDLAAKWYLAAAGQGDVDAQCNLGVCYENGTGVEKDWEQAFHWYRLAAEQGLALAQNNLGVCYGMGHGVERDGQEALKWIRAAAENGNPTAQTNLGLCYEEGRGMEKDAHAALKWFHLAAAQGDARAQNNLGWCYENGTGVEKDEQLAVHWYRLAADQGLARAQRHLGLCYERGTGVPQDAAEAVRWYRRAADQGFAEAQYNLGLCYAQGIGVPQDTAEAAKWFRAAAENGHAAAAKALEGYAL